MFTVSHLHCAFLASDVAEVLHAPRLEKPPGLPPLVEGVLLLGDVPIPVIRLDRLFALPEIEVGLYTPIIVLRGAASPLALLVDELLDVAAPEIADLAPVDENQSFNGCVGGLLRLGDTRAAVLDPARVLRLEERRRLEAFRTEAARRLQAAEGTT